jgi:CHASE3 domain
MLRPVVPAGGAGAGAYGAAPIRRPVVGTRIGSQGETGLLRSAVLASGAAVAAAAVLLAVLVSTLTGQQQSNGLVRRSETVLRTAANGERAVVDMETGLRGFVITRDRTFLEPYSKGVPAAQAAVDGLLAQRRGEPAEQRIAARLRTQVMGYVTGYARPVLALVTGNAAAARSEPPPPRASAASTPCAPTSRR